MKKGFAILTFLIFFFSQFGKVINFCCCTIATYQQTATVHCDCEKQLVTNTDADKQPHSNAAQLPATDDLYHLHNSTAFSCRTFDLPASYLPAHTESLYNGYYSNIFHPPGQPA